MDEKAIDIIIPSFRLEEQFLLPILSLNKPPYFRIHFFIVCDNPGKKIPDAIQQLSNSGVVTIILNETNLGPSASRNKGIQSGNAKWILLLDDDIRPEENLLHAYAAAIQRHPDAIGFAGPCFFPRPFNAATTAFDLNGSTSHFTAASRVVDQYWVPTANVMLNREKLDGDLFDPELRTGEDIDFLLRNALRFGGKYISVPDAIVLHPWWNNGTVQTKRQFQYGIGASQLLTKSPVKNYTWFDFTNTPETLLLWLILLPFAIWFGWNRAYLLFPVALVFAEWLTNLFKAIWLGKTASPIVASLLAWTKNCQEAGQLYGTLSKMQLSAFAKRIDLGFGKAHPSPFRLNRWKIIKMLVLIAVYLVIAV